MSWIPESVLRHYSFQSNGIRFEDVTNVSMVRTEHHRLSKEVFVRYVGLFKIVLDTHAMSVSRGYIIIGTFALASMADCYRTGGCYDR